MILSFETFLLERVKIMRKEKAIYIKKYIYYFLGLIIVIGIISYICSIMFQQLITTLSILILLKLLKYFTFNLCELSLKLEKYFPQE